MAFKPFYQWRLQRSEDGRPEKLRALTARFGGKVPCIVNGARMRLDLNELIQQMMFLDIWEPDQTAWVKACLGPGKRFVDVGANFGYFTTLASRLVGPRGSVFAFEPSPVAADVLREAIAAAPLRNVRFHQAAVGAEAGVLGLYMPVNSAIHSPSAFVSEPDYPRLEVPLLTLDGVVELNDGAPIDMIKMDVEGSEPEVIEGALNLIGAGRVLNILCEMNSGWLRRNNTTPQALTDRILGLGYRIVAMTEKQVHPEKPGGPTFEMQDIWFSRSSGA